MSDDLVTFEVKGLDELQKTFEELPRKVARRGIRQAARAGANVIKDGMVALAPRDSGFLADHIDVKTKMNKDELAGSAFVGPNGKDVYPKKPGEHARTAATVARFLEFGTTKTAKKPFMTQAFESQKEKALDAIVEKLKDALDD